MITDADEEELPILPAHRTAGLEYGAVDFLKVWCAHERRWYAHKDRHIHRVRPEPGCSDGPRASHCKCPNCPRQHPYPYVIREVGDWTDEVKATHRDEERLGDEKRARGGYGCDCPSPTR